MALNELDRRAKFAREREEGPPALGNLALLYEGILTSIVRLQASRQQIPDAESFKKRTKAALQEIEQVSVSAGCDGQDIRDTHFAVVALLDSVVLHSNDPVRAEWERKLLQEELFDKTDAGIVFFEKLAQFHSRRDSETLANILEVYLLCLLLGFEGRYSGASRGDLDSIVDRTRRRIENIRGRATQISPSGVLPMEPPVAEAPQDRHIDRFRWIAFAIIIFTVLWFVAFKIDLSWTSETLRSKLP